MQPPEPLELWSSPPFVATIRDGRLYARGAADDKGQVWIHVQAIAAGLATDGKLPVNVVLLIEGEEEIGSPSLSGFLATHRERLACDYIAISDTMMFAPGVPNILASMRGLAYFELTVRTASSDLHSGQYGGAVPNAAASLARIVSSLQEADGRVAISGFYDDVRDPGPARRQEVAGLAFDERRFGTDVGLARLTGDEAFTALERLWLRPSCDVNGLSGGYTGEGAKTVIPAAASAKVSFRLVPDQTPERVERQLRDHVVQLGLPGVDVQIRPFQGARPWHMARGAAVSAARRALSTVFKQEAVLGGTGGTIPVVPELERCLEADILLIGFGLPGENAHAPNEWIDLATVGLGIQAMTRLYEELAAARGEIAHSGLEIPGGST